MKIMHDVLGFSTFQDTVLILAKVTHAFGVRTLDIKTVS